jgi:hypothetical protein
VIAALQQGLKQRGVNCRHNAEPRGAKRTGVRLQVEHDHRHGDASGEIVSWSSGCNTKCGEGHLVGHSRGAAQAALVMVERADLGVRGLVLAAPLHQTREIARATRPAFAAVGARSTPPIG